MIVDVRRRIIIIVLDHRRFVPGSSWVFDLKNLFGFEVESGLLKFNNIPPEWNKYLSTQIFVLRYISFGNMV
jgi:hypothetical protein